MPIMIPNNNLTPGTLRGVYASLLLGQVVTGAILYFLSSQSTTEQAPASATTGLQIWQLVACALLLFAVLTAAWLRGRLVQSATRPDVQQVATNALVAWALVEGANLATVILAYRYNDTSLFLAFVVGVPAFLWLHPGTWPLEDEK